MLSDKTKHLIETFLIKHSGGNIKKIKGITYSKYTVGGFDCNVADFRKGFNITVVDRIIIQCYCKDSHYFPAMENLGDMLLQIFRPLLNNVGDVKIEYEFPMYYCRD